MGWWMPLVAFASMVVQDMLGTRLVQAEASYRAVLAGAMDTAQDACAMASWLILGDAVLIGHDYLLSSVVIGARLAADFSGTYTGTKLGERLDRRKPAPCCPHCTGPHGSLKGES